MIRRYTLLLVAISIGLLSIFYPQKEVQSKESKQYPGRNNTVLLLTNADSGLGNVVLATLYALLVEHPDLELHIGTFGKFVKPVQNVKNSAAMRTGRAGSLKTHLFKGRDLIQNVEAEDGVELEELIGKPGLAGLNRFLVVLPKIVMSWTGPDYLSLYREAVDLIEEVDPAVVIVETLLIPGLSAVRDLGRREAIISPNALKDTFSDQQSGLRMLWQYPVSASGYRYPVPGYLIPSNIWMVVKMALSILRNPINLEKAKWLKAQGIINVPTAITLYNKDTLWLSGSTVDTDFPLDVLPGNAIQCGPIFLSSGPAAEQDPELAEWLKRAPTILIMLGSHTTYSEEGARAFAHVLKNLFETTSLQVLWKFEKRTLYSDDFLSELSEELASKRLVLSKWIKPDPAALLETGDIVLFVHHGGANCYHEAVGTGIPQIVLPMWADCYDYAIRAEYRGIGVWGNEKAAPEWSVEELGGAFAKVLGNHTEATAIREKAAALGKKLQQDPGKSVAAREIARLARLGNA